MNNYLLCLAITFLIAVTNAQKPGDFLSCLPTGTKGYSANTSMYANLTSLGYNNDVKAMKNSPIYIVLAQTTAQVSNAVKCAAQFNLQVCVRSGGHSFVGRSLCTGVMIDVGPMNQIWVHPRWNVTTIGAGATIGELLWTVHKQQRWVAAGVCPGVGVGGYTLGGGHGLYEGKLGLMCDALKEVTMVTRTGDVIVASAKQHQELFWGLCGGGGGQFGIVTSFKLYTASSNIYDNAVVFRFHWPQNRIGELLQKWIRYDEEGGLIRVQMEMNLAPRTGMNGIGACYNSASVDDCLAHLKKAAFFNVAGRKQLLLTKVKNALDLHAFMGPVGGWGERLVPNLRKAMLEQRYGDAGWANSRSFQSTYINSNPDAKFWQAYADFCAFPNLHSIPWILCELRLMQNAVTKPCSNSFPHRNNRLLTHYIIGVGTPDDRSAAYRKMSQILKPYTTGVYSNYEELELGKYTPSSNNGQIDLGTYPQMYWGRSLCRLRALKSKFDPNLFFANPQPIPPLSWNVVGTKC